MPNDSQDHFDNKWLPWKQNKKYLVYLMFSASLKSTPDSLQNFNSLKIRVLEITGGRGVGSTPSPKYKVWVPNISTWEGLKSDSKGPINQVDWGDLR